MLQFINNPRAVEGSLESQPKVRKAWNNLTGIREYIVCL